MVSRGRVLVRLVHTDNDGQAEEVLTWRSRTELSRLQENAVAHLRRVSTCMDHEPCRRARRLLLAPEDRLHVELLPGGGDA